MVKIKPDPHMNYGLGVAGLVFGALLAVAQIGLFLATGTLSAMFIGCAVVFLVAGGTMLFAAQEDLAARQKRSQISQDPRQADEEELSCEEFDRRFEDLD